MRNVSKKISAKKYGGKMDYQVSDEAHSVATKCDKGFSCLKRERKDLCKVDFYIKGKVYFVKCLNEGYCPYKHPFGSSFFCSCPVRKELFDKHKI